MNLYITLAEIKISLDKLHLIKQDAFKALIEEKLLANEGFNIILGLTDTIVLQILKKIRRNKLNLYF